MKALLLASVFVLHAAAFLVLYARRPDRIHYVLSVSGFLHLAAFYGYRAWANATGPAVYWDWVAYLRWSGAAMCLLGAGPLALRLYGLFRRRLGRRPSNRDRAKASSGPYPS